MGRPRSADRRRRGLTWAAICRMAKELPGVVTDKPNAMPAVRLGQRTLLVWLRGRGTTVAIKVDPIDRDVVMKMDPEAFYLTGQYRRYPVVLMRLDKARPEIFEGLLRSAWRRHASNERPSGRRASRPRAG